MAFEGEATAQRFVLAADEFQWSFRQPDQRFGADVLGGVREVGEYHDSGFPAVEHSVALVAEDVGVVGVEGHQLPAGELRPLPAHLDEVAEVLRTRIAVAAQERRTSASAGPLLGRLLDSRGIRVGMNFRTRGSLSGSVMRLMAVLAIWSRGTRTDVRGVGS
ncbi:hypothetical protein, partial [Arthrobacter sp.]|uniref:hypothetical protein n=1 Tax=Arthrobacter sp. TaxID=1667 RepID=UPI003391B89A